MEAAEELAKVEGELKLAAEREDIAALEENGQEAAPALEEFQSQAAIYGFEDCSEEPGAADPGRRRATAPAAKNSKASEEGGVEPEPEYVEPEYEEPAPEEEAAPETGGAGGGPKQPGTGARNRRRIRRRRTWLISVGGREGRVSPPPRSPSRSWSVPRDRHPSRHGARRAADSTSGLQPRSRR